MFEQRNVGCFGGKWGCLGLALPNTLTKILFTKVVSNDQSNTTKNGGIFNGNEIVYYSV